VSIRTSIPPGGDSSEVPSKIGSWEIMGIQTSICSFDQEQRIIGDGHRAFGHRLAGSQFEMVCDDAVVGVAV